LGRGICLGWAGARDGRFDEHDEIKRMKKMWLSVEKHQTTRQCCEDEKLRKVFSTLRYQMQAPNHMPTS